MRKVDMKDEFMRFIHFSGKIFGHTKAEFKNFDGEDSFIESWALFGFSIYKVSQNNLRTISRFMNKGGGFIDERLISLRKRIELEKDDQYGEAMNQIEEQKEIIHELRMKKLNLSSAILNLKYSARTVLEDFDDMELEELK